MKHPKTEKLVVYVMPDQLEFLNQRLAATGLNRSAQAREALKLLMAKCKNESAVLYDAKAS